MIKDIHRDVPGQSEDALQQKIVFWFHNTYPQWRGLLHHSPNGGSRNAREGAKFKAIGTQAGFPDLILNLQGRSIFFELKNDNGKLSKAQEDYIYRLREQGFEVYVLRSLARFKTVIELLVSELSSSELSNWRALENQGKLPL